MWPTHGTPEQRLGSFTTAATLLQQCTLIYVTKLPAGLPPAPSPNAHLENMRAQPLLPAAAPLARTLRRHKPTTMASFIGRQLQPSSMQRYVLLAAAALMFFLIASSALRFPPTSEHPAATRGSTARQHEGTARHLSFPSTAELKLVQVVHRCADPYLERETDSSSWLCCAVRPALWGVERPIRSRTAPLSVMGHALPALGMARMMPFACATDAPSPACMYVCRRGLGLVLACSRGRH